MHFSAVGDVSPVRSVKQLVRRREMLSTECGEMTEKWTSNQHALFVPHIEDGKKKKHFHKAFCFSPNAEQPESSWLINAT